jgi:hypothetical protein
MSTIKNDKELTYTNGINYLTTLENNDNLIINSATISGLYLSGIYFTNR